MDILYISNTCSNNELKNIFEKSKNYVCQQSLKFNKLLANGFVLNSCNVTALSSRPINKNTNSKIFFTRKTDIENNINFIYLPFLNFKYVRQICLYYSAKMEIKKWIKKYPNGIIVIDILNYSLLKAMINCTKNKKNMKTAIITDVPDILYKNNYNTKFIKKINKLIEKCDNYVLLTTAMKDKFDIKNKKFCVIEGICEECQQTKNDSNDKNIIMYTGTINKDYGIDKLIFAFIDANIKNSELHIYGSGNWINELKNIIKTTKNIKYFGNKANSYIINEQQKVRLLVNPRPINEEYTKYSFPSKIMEYISSGTPMLTTNIPSMPEEYKKHCFVVNDCSVESLSKGMQNIFKMAPADLKQFGLNAMQWIVQEKNNKKQAEKIINTLFH